MGGTIRALREGGVPVAHRFVGVARQRGSSRGTLHSDHRNYMLSTLTPLVVPGPCGVLGRSRASGGLEYHEEERRLQPGETVILDNSFPHQVYNDAEADRFVLMCEVWHPALTPAEREALVTLFALKDRFTLLELKQRPWGAHLPYPSQNRRRNRCPPFCVTPASPASQVLRWRSCARAWRPTPSTASTFGRTAAARLPRRPSRPAARPLLPRVPSDERQRPRAKARGRGRARAALVDEARLRRVVVVVVVAALGKIHVELIIDDLVN